MLWLELQRRGAATLTRQLYDQLVGRILSGELAANTRLPSSRELARELAVARNLVIDVYEQLVAEGYLETRSGAGTFVTALPWPRVPARPAARPVPAREEHVVAPDVISFSTGVPDLARFPRARWLHCVRQVGFFSPMQPWSYTDPAGDPALRVEIAAYLRRVKGLDCSVDNVIVTSGTAHGVLLVALALRDRPARALVEDPTISFVPTILRRCAYRVVPVPVDEHGLVVGALPARGAAALVVVSASHQFPLGSTLPVQRRLALLDYARRHGAVIVEDDYDGEFRFAGAPVSSLYRLDPERVVHAGTFSKALSPALRLGYLVVPNGLAEQFQRVVGELAFTSSALNQAALARFLRAGHLERHLVRMKRVYHRKMRLLEQSLADAFGPGVRVAGNTTGLHLVAHFSGSLRRRLTAGRLAAAGVEADLADDFAAKPGAHPGALVLGYGNLEPDAIREGVRRLARALSA